MPTGGDRRRALGRWLARTAISVFDDLGNLNICGRSKNVIVLPNGENVYPEAIEHRINSYSWVGEGLARKQRPHRGWIYPDYEAIDEETAAGQGRKKGAHGQASRTDAQS
jgi:long-chain acyl-CoA synthetase